MLLAAIVGYGRVYYRRRPIAEMISDRALTQSLTIISLLEEDRSSESPRCFVHVVASSLRPRIRKTRRADEPVVYTRTRRCNKNEDNIQYLRRR